jgi:hypothetical protein
MFPSATAPTALDPGGATTPPREPATVPANGVTEAPPTAGRVLSEKDADEWRGRIKASLEVTKPAIEDGKTNIQRYMGKPLATAPTVDEAVVPTDYYYIETKKNQVLFRLPEVFVKPEEPGREDAAVVFQAALNKKLGRRGLNVLPTMKQVVFDVLCPLGYAGVAVGFQTIVDGTAPVELGKNPADGTSIMGVGPNITAKWIFVEHIRGGDLLCDAEFSGLDYDKAPWVAQRFREDVLDDDAAGSNGTDDRRLAPLPGQAQMGQRKQRTGYEIWYRAHLFDADVKHPDKIRVFKIYDDDRDAKITVRDHPHQRYATAAGQLASGMRGFGVKIFSLRYISDVLTPPSDCTMARNTADELSRGRTQQLRSRDRNQPQWGFDATRVDKDIQGKIEKGEIQGGIPFNGPGQDATWPIQKGTAPKETYQFNDVIHGDLQRIWRTGDNQLSVLSDTSRTATEQQITASSAQSASEADRGAFGEWFADKIAAEVAALMQLYTDETEFVELVGADAQRLKSIPPEIQQQAQAAGQDARVLVPFNKDLLAGRYAFDIKPNSQAYIDAGQEANAMMKDYQFFANSPNINKAELERQILQRRGYDTSKLLQAPPPRESPPPSVSLSAKGEDLNPQTVQGASMVLALSKLGVPMDPAAVTMATQTLQSASVISTQLSQAGLLVPQIPQTSQGHPETEHGGAVHQAEPINKHQADQTGGMQGSGQPAPLGAGGLH